MDILTGRVRRQLERMIGCSELRYTSGMGGDRYEYYDFWPDKFGWRGQHSVAEKFHALLAQAFDRHIAVGLVVHR